MHNVGNVDIFVLPKFEKSEKFTTSIKIQSIMANVNVLSNLLGS